MKTKKGFAEGTVIVTSVSLFLVVGLICIAELKFVVKQRAPSTDETRFTVRYLLSEGESMPPS